MSKVRPTTVSVAHENAVIEAGLRHILGAWPEFEVLPPQGGDTTLSVPQGGVPELLLADHGGGMRWALGHAHDPFACTKVMVVGSAGQDVDVRGALAAGVRGYVFGGCSPDEILSGVRAVAAGRRHLCSAAAQHLANCLAHPTLTLREGEVLSLVSRGRSNKEVARIMGISVGTVKSHMRALLAKLGAKCRTEALWIAAQRRLMPGSEGGFTDPQQAPDWDEGPVVFPPGRVAANAGIRSTMA